MNDVDASAPTWRQMDSAPKDGTAFWAYLYETGIRLIRWMSAEECAEDEDGDAEDYEGDWVQVSDKDEVWVPRWWLPQSAISIPVDDGALAPDQAEQRPVLNTEGGAGR